MHPFDINKATARFHRNYEKSPNGCWNWTGYFDGHGYGKICINYRQSSAHRVSWALHNGYDVEYNPDGCILHSCDNPACVNPEHLRLGSFAENTADMVSRSRSRGQRKTHCKNGHEFNEENTLFAKGKLTTRRVCRKCSCIRSAEYQKKKKE